jgi:hypothetical protein
MLETYGVRRPKSFRRTVEPLTMMRKKMMMFLIVNID